MPAAPPDAVVVGAPDDTHTGSKKPVLALYTRTRAACRVVAGRTCDSVKKTLPAASSATSLGNQAAVAAAA